MTMINPDHQTDSYRYILPEEQIAQTPLKQRSLSRMLVYNRQKNRTEDQVFKDIVEYLDHNCVLVRNATRVVPLRFEFQKTTGRRIELLIVGILGNGQYEVIMSHSDRVHDGETIELVKDRTIGCHVVSGQGKQTRIVELVNVDDFELFANQYGQVPTPGYIVGGIPLEQYQTIYAREGFSAAAPTVGLHMDQMTEDRTRERGTEIIDVYLTVGIGTFTPVFADDVRDHKIHTESYEIDQLAAEQLNQARKDKKTIVALGTTTLRVLETVGNDDVICAHRGETNIFIYPPYKCSMVDALITNFHTSASTLLMLVSAFVGSREKTLNLYQYAIDKEYRFLSLGDCMFIR